MALSERIEEDKIEIVGPYKYIQVRTATIIERDGVEISRTYNRKIIVPGQDITNESADIQALCTLLHTPEIISSYTQFNSNQE